MYVVVVFSQVVVLVMWCRNEVTDCILSRSTDNILVHGRSSQLLLWQQYYKTTLSRLRVICPLSK